MTVAAIARFGFAQKKALTKGLERPVGKRKSEHIGHVAI
jgi:hypothetical protein